jgi:hypothetical protein
MNDFNPSAVPPAADPFADPASAPRDWGDPQPLPAGAPGVPPFDIALLPDTLRPWVEDVSERTQTPPDFAAVTLMVEAGALIGRQVVIRPKRADDWAVVPNLWGMIVGRPSMLKTPLMREATRPVRGLEAEARREFEAAMKEYEVAMEVFKLERKGASKEAAAALKGAGKGTTKVKGTREQAAQKLTEGEAEPERPVWERFMTNDSTVEKMGELLRDIARGCILLWRDELMGFLRGLERDGREQDRSFYLEAWDGCGRFIFDRIGRGTIVIESCAVSILGACCPGPLQAWIGARASAGQGDDGFLQRFQVAVWPDARAEFENVDRREPCASSANIMTMAMRQLAGAGVLAGGEEVVHLGSDDGLASRVLRFSPEAQDLFDAWRIGLEQRLREPDIVPAWESHLGKYRSLGPSLALIFELLEAGPFRPAHTVGAKAWQRAEEWMAYLEGHARRIYDGFLRPHAVPARALAAKLLDGALPEPFRLRDVYRPQWAGLTPDARDHDTGPHAGRGRERGRDPGGRGMARGGGAGGRDGPPDRGLSPQPQV